MEGSLDICGLQKTMQKNGILINFSGKFSQEVIEELGEAVRRYLETEMTSQNETYNVFSVFIEQTQNIRNYSERDHAPDVKEKIANSGIVIIGKVAQRYFVCSGNLVENKDVAKLEEKLCRLDGLDKVELKKLYKVEMKKDLLPGATSAGVGFIDMARRSISPLEYNIARVDDELSFFTLKVYV